MTAPATARRIPLIPTILVIAAACVMVALGIWQLGRADEKGELIAEYQAAISNPQPLTEFPANRSDDPTILYRRLEFECARVLGWRATAGRNSSNQSGYVHVAQCDEPNLFGFGIEASPYEADVVVGWSRGPEQPDWSGGTVSGTIVPGSDGIVRVVADPPLAGLEANAAPDPNDLPNNHLAYAGQWFFFALTALVIYWLALRRRWREQG